MARSESLDIPVAKPSHASRLVEPDFTARIGDWMFATARAALIWGDGKRLRVSLGALWRLC
jgi:hypothetical protein